MARVARIDTLACSQCKTGRLRVVACVAGVKHLPLPGVAPHAGQARGRRECVGGMAHGSASRRRRYFSLPCPPGRGVANCALGRQHCTDCRSTKPSAPRDRPANAAQRLAQWLARIPAAPGSTTMARMRRLTSIQSPLPFPQEAITRGQQRYGGFVQHGLSAAGCSVPLG